MRSSTSSSDRDGSAATPTLPPQVQPAVLTLPVEAIAQPASNAPSVPPFERPLPRLDYGVVGVVAVVFFVLAVGAWEAYWRIANQSVPSIRNSAGLWAAQRRRIDAGEGAATVLIGSSRMLSDVQLSVWERLSGERPIQLSLEGTSPLAALEDLAADTLFTGRLFVGVTPPIFFTGFEFRGDVIAEWRDETPSQRSGQWLSQHLLEPNLAFLDPDFALIRVLERGPWPQREGRPYRRPVPKLFLGDGDRNQRLWHRIENDTVYRDMVRAVWSSIATPPPPPGSKDAEKLREGTQRQIERAAAAVARLRARGVEVVFIRHPSSGRFLDAERRSMPREETWDVLLARTGARGIHFEDYAELSAYEAPEWSHLTAADADRYTEALWRLVAER